MTEYIDENLDDAQGKELEMLSGDKILRGILRRYDDKTLYLDSVYLSDWNGFEKSLGDDWRILVRNIAAYRRVKHDE